MDNSVYDPNSVSTSAFPEWKRELVAVARDQAAKYAWGLRKDPKVASIGIKTLHEWLVRTTLRIKR